MSVNDVRYTNTGGNDGYNGEAEQTSQLEFSFKAHLALDNYRDWEDDEEEVGYDVESAHSNQLSKTLATLRSWVGNDLPVLIARSAFRNVRDNDSDKRCE